MHDPNLGTGSMTMKKDVGKKVVGITNSPMMTKTSHGSPADWWQLLFDKEEKAREWKERMAAKEEFVPGTDTGGWKYGYTYTITADSDEK